MTATRITRIILIGPQGSGKGTQAAFFATHLGVPSISTGDLFRDHIKQGTALGKKAQELVRAGKLVPDEITNAMIAERLQQPDTVAGYILDGYPRTSEQAAYLDTVASPHCVVEIQLSEAAANQRINRRRIDADTGDTVSLDLMTAEQQSYYQQHPEKLVVRSDDTPAAVTERLTLYRNQTQPVLEYYRAQGKLITVDGAPTVAEVTQSIEKQLTTFSTRADV